METITEPNACKVVINWDEYMTLKEIVPLDDSSEALLQNMQQEKDNVVLSGTSASMDVLNDYVALEANQTFSEHRHILLDSIYTKIKTASLVN